MKLKDRTPVTDAALDGIVQALAAAGFTPPSGLGVVNRNALATALVSASIDHELRIRIDRRGRPNVRGQLLEGAEEV